MSDPFLPVKLSLFLKLFKVKKAQNTGPVGGILTLKRTPFYMFQTQAKIIIKKKLWKNTVLIENDHVFSLPFCILDYPCKIKELKVLIRKSVISSGSDSPFDTSIVIYSNFSKK